MTTQVNNKTLVQSCYQAFGTGDITALFDQMQDSVEWHSLYTKDISLNGIYMGKAQIGELLTKIGSDLSITSFTPTAFLADGNTVAVLGQEEAMVNKTQKTYQNKWVHVWETVDGKVAKITTYNAVEPVLDAFTN